MPRVVTVRAVPCDGEPPTVALVVKTADGAPGRAVAMRAWWAVHRRALLAAGAGVAGALSVIWFRIVPDAVDGATGWAWLALRLGHGVCWALLAASMIIGVADGPRRLRSGLAWAALAAYAAFVLALVTR